MVTPHLKQDVRRTDTDTVHYPIDDDEPLAESEYQLFPLTYAHAALRSWFEDNPTVWVGADMFLYYEEGVPSSVVAPDVFVVTQTHKRHLRNIFQAWVEGRVPELVLEVMSRTRLYAVTQWRSSSSTRGWEFESTGFTTRQRRASWILGCGVMRSCRGEYRPIEMREVDGKYVGVSDVLGLEFHANAEWFRFFNPISGEYLPDYQENQQAQVEAETLARTEQAAREAAEAQAEQERAAREAAEARLAAMEAELRRLRGQQRPS